MNNISRKLYNQIIKAKCLLFKRTYRCIFGMQAYDDEFVLSDTQRCVIIMALHNTTLMSIEEKAFYIIEKCEGNSLSVTECMFVLSVFRFHNVDDFFDMDCGCKLCDRLNRYNPRVIQ